jgi:hypothetical protein
MTCPMCNHEGEKIEIREDLENKNVMYKFISCSSCGRLLEKQKFMWSPAGKTKMEDGRVLMKVKQIKFFGKTETVLAGSKEPEFIARARNRYRPEKKRFS